MLKNIRLYFYVLKSPEKPVQEMPSMGSEPQIIIPEEVKIPSTTSTATSTEYRGFRELLEGEE